MCETTRSGRFSIDTNAFFYYLPRAFRFFQTTKEGSPS